MKKVTLNYDELNGNLTDKFGCIIITYGNLQYEDAAKSMDVESLVELKKAGYTCDEIVTLKKHDLI